MSQRVDTYDADATYETYDTRAAHDTYGTHDTYDTNGIYDPHCAYVAEHIILDTCYKSETWSIQCMCYMVPMVHIIHDTGDTYTYMYDAYATNDIYDTSET